MGTAQNVKAVFCTELSAADRVHEILRFRKRFFVDLLGWDLQVKDGLEVDQFDTESASYCAVYLGEEIVGGFRAIRTDYPYLAREVFPRLASTLPFPSRRDCWEISRFGVLPGADRIRMARINYALMFRFAFLRSAMSLVAVADPTHERVLKSLGIRSARYGPPQQLARLADGTPITLVAGEIRLSEQRDSRFQALLDYARLVEIADETSVLGHRRISA